MSKSQITTIEDPLLEPYFITKDETCFTVHGRVIPDGKHFRSKKGGTEYAKPQGYYPNLEQALDKISRERVYSEDTMDLNKLIENIKLVQKETKEFINGGTGI